MRTDGAVSSLRDLPSRHVLVGPSGVSATCDASGALTALEAHGLSLLLHPATAMEAGLANIHLRVLEGASARAVPLLGPSSRGRVHWCADGMWVTGEEAGVAYRLDLRLSPDPGVAAFYWQLQLDNRSNAEVTVDAVLTHDPALAPIGAVRTNEYYVAQYLDLTALDLGDQGLGIAVRQNMPGETSPWLLLGSLGRAIGWATDAVQLVERTAAGTVWSGLGRRDLPDTRVQHEHSLAVLADEPVTLAPGERHETGFYGIAVVDHPDASSPVDEGWAQVARRAEPPRLGGGEAEDRGAPVVATLFATADAYPCRDLPPEDRRRGVDSVPRERELAVLRPHAHILRTGSELRPDERSLASTVWMGGTFHSQVTRGHVGRDPLLTGRRTYLGLLRAHGLRIFVGSADGTGWQLLDTPSRWSLEPDRCTWTYAGTDGPTISVTSSAPAGSHTLTLDVVTDGGEPRPLLVALQLGDDATDVRGPAVDGGGVTIGPWRLDWEEASVDAVAHDGPLRADGIDTRRTWLTLAVPPRPAWGLEIRGVEDPTTGATAHPAADDGDREGFWAEVTEALRLEPTDSGTADADIRALDAALPWFVHNALVHYLSPRGIEQFSGGGWGTRDVCQGPVGLLTALGRQDVVRDVLLRVFRAQNARGDWPQAFEFLPPLPTSGQQDSHGDVVHWPVLATGEYLQATGDAGLLGEQVAMIGDDGPTEPSSVLDHLRRAVARIEDGTVPGSPLPAYGHGDWNDSLQPADPELARNLVSTWTSVLQSHALRALAEGLRCTGEAADLADRALDLSRRTATAVTGSLLQDGVLPGYALFAERSVRELLVHPTDTRTGLTYGVLPWIHAISGDLLSPEDARRHLELIEEHLLGPDGARLFDAPVAYSGGPMHVFQRAEASTFWGREIGLMYMHAHLRYAEALARVGDAERLVRALRLVSPVDVERVVPQARPRQQSCYFSSSDGVLRDRGDASARYADLMAGRVPLEGGWRIYSSGPGLALRLVVECLLGFRARGPLTEIDPVLPATLDGLLAHLPVAGRPARVRYTVRSDGGSVRAVRVGGSDLPLSPLSNPYRAPGVCVPTDALASGLAAGAEIEVEIA